MNGISDIETVYRQRYLDLITMRKALKDLSLEVNCKNSRDFYFENNFIEIETPVLWNVFQCTAAKPFITQWKFWWRFFP